MANTSLYRLVWIPSGLALIGSVAAFALKPHTVPAPAEMITFVSSDKTLSVGHPANWQSQSIAAGGNMVEVTYHPLKNAEIRFSTDLEGSLMADISRSTSAMPDTSNMPPELAQQLGGAMEKRKTPLETMHEAGARLPGKTLDSYREEKTSKVQLAGLEALCTDFTCQASDIFSKRELIGKRFTALSNDRRVTVLYYIPRDAEEKLGPTIREMIKSLRIGQQGG